MSAIIKRATFIAANHAQIALSQKTMFELSGDEEGVREVPIPESFKKSGIPEGYSVDFNLDPSTLVKALAQTGITTESQLPEGLLDELKVAINTPTNLNIIPTSLHECKRAIEDGPEYPEKE